MRKIFIFTLFMLAVSVFGQVELNLLPSKMEQYIGKMSRVDFEKIVGEPLEEVEGQVTYNIINDVGGNLTTIWCTYHHGVLVGMRFPAAYAISYWMDFYFVKGYPRNEKEAQKRGLLRFKKDVFGEVIRVDMHIRHLGMHLTDMKTQGGTVTGLINYYYHK